MTLLTIALAASRLSISESSVRRLIARGRLVAHRFGGCVRVSEADLDAFVARCRKPPVTFLPTAHKPLRILTAPEVLAARTRPR